MHKSVKIHFKSEPENRKTDLNGGKSESHLIISKIGVCLAPESCFNNVFNAQMIDEINSWVHISDTGKQVKFCVTAASSPEPLLAPL